MSTEFNNQLSTLLDDVAGGISPRSDFAGAQAGAAEMTLTSVTPGGRRPFRTGIAAVAALLLLIAGGVLAYQRASGDGDSLSTASELTPDPTVPGIANTPGDDGDGSSAAAVPEQHDDDRGDELKDGDESGPLAKPVHSVDLGLKAEVTETDFSNDPPLITLRGKAPDGKNVRVSSLAGSAETVSDGGKWKVVLELDDLAGDASGKLLIVVTYGDDEASQELWVKLPADESDDDSKDDADEPKDDADEPKDEDPKDEPKDDPTPVVVAFTAAIDGNHWDYEPPKVHLAGKAQPGSKVFASHQYGDTYVKADSNGNWSMWYKLWDIGPGQTANIRVTNAVSGSVYEFDATVPESEPIDVAFTAAIDGNHWDYEPPKVHLAGKAQPGSKVFASHQYGDTYVKADSNGNWSMWYKLWDIGPGQTANIRVTNAVSGSVYEFDATVPESEPIDVAFTANAVEGDLAGDPIWHRFSGTAEPGSTVLASSAYGAEDVAVGASGEWTLKLWMNNVPAGTEFKVTVTNTASGDVFKFWLETPAGEPEPEPVDFTAHAVYGTCDDDPPYDVYHGTAQPGTVVKVISPYGGAEFTVGESGNYEKTVYFADAPIGETFTVKVKSLATGEYAEFAFTRVAPE